jgi:excisionase family DNA binding protein
MHEHSTVEWLSVEEVAEKLSVSVPTVRGWLARGELRGHRLGERLIRIRVVDVDAMFTPLDIHGDSTSIEDEGARRTHA